MTTYIILSGSIVILIACLMVSNSREGRKAILKGRIDAARFALRDASNRGDSRRVLIAEEELRSLTQRLEDLGG